MKLALRLVWVVAIIALAIIKPSAAATLKITAGSAPAPVAVNQTASVSFSAAFYSTDDQGNEIPAQNVASQSYTIYCPGTISGVHAPKGYAVTYPDSHTAQISADGNSNSGTSFSVSANVSFSTAGTGMSP